jgi:hypothetical protein
MQCDHVALAARTAGILFLALLLAVAPAASAPASGAHERAAQILISSAGWDGRAIQQPHRHDVVRTSTASRRMRGWSAGAVSFGAGFHNPGGSTRVREVQRRLSRLGYHVGPVDGLFGRLTRASVAWFQVKHGVEVDGRATLETVRHLRARTRAGGGGRATTRLASGEVSQRHSAGSGPEVWEAFNQLVRPRLAPDDGTGIGESSPLEPTLVALVAANLLLLIALLLKRKSRRAGSVAADPAAGPDVRTPPEHYDEPHSHPRPNPAEAKRATRRFAPPEPAVEPRPPGRAPRGTRNDEPVGGHE